MKPKNPLLVFTLVAAGLALSSTAFAADQYWYGNAQNWTTNANWSSTDVSGGAQTWVSGNNAFFASVAGRVQVSASTAANNVTVTKANLDFRFTGSRNLTINGTWSDLSTTTYGNNSASNYVFTLTTDGTSTLSGKFSPTSTGTLGFTKAGTGQVTLAGVTTSSLFGPATVSAGTLIITGAINTSSGVTVSSGATLGGEGNGTTTGKVSAITLNGGSGAGGMLAPGNGTAGDLGTLYGTSLTWNGATDSIFSQMKFDLSNSDTTSDQLVLTGAMNKGTGTIFDWDFGNTGFLGSTYTLVTAPGGFGSFDVANFSYKAGSLTSGLDGSFSISGNDLRFTTFSAIPEPNSALAGLLIGAGLLRRRRA